MNPITVFQLASWTIGLWDYWLVGIEAGAGPTAHFLLNLAIFTNQIKEFARKSLNHKSQAPKIQVN